ncbi:MAG: D-alanyl-D-alanine carboxypeptidase [Clostridia bacterium]|nr:D-alanyl-D-alanine carboxypeptidase [Clostridia bacterium]
MTQMKPSERGNASASEQTYIKPLSQKKAVTYTKTVALLVIVLLLSLTVLLGMFAVMHYRSNENAKAIAALESQLAEQRKWKEIAEAAATAIQPIDEPKIDHAASTAQTQSITNINSGYAILIDTAKNEVVASKNGNERIYPASMTKVMTLIVAAEHITDLDELFTFDYTITDPAYEAGASVAGFLAGESVSMRDILYGVALPSGADATTAIAIKVAGSEEVFAELMNRKAADMGLTDTHFVNASGLHDRDHYSTPQEIAIIMEYAMQIPLIAEILSTYQYTTAATEQHPNGILLTSTTFSRMYGNEAGNCTVIAGKTGYTPEAGQCLVSVAETPDGARYILVTASASGTYAPVYDAIDIYKKYLPQA